MPTPLDNRPDNVKAVDFVRGPNETNVEYAARILLEYGDATPDDRFIPNATGDPFILMPPSEAFQLVYSIVCHMTGKY